MQHHTHMDNIHLAHQPPQGTALAELESIGLYQCRLKSIPVTEEIIPEPDELPLQLRAVHITPRSAVVHQFADVLADAAAYIEIRRPVSDA